MPFTPQKPSLSRPEIALPTFVFPAILPGDTGALKTLLHARQAAVTATVESAVDAAIEATTARIRREAQETIARMIEQMVLARHRQFGVSSEQLPGQTRLFDEAEMLAQASTEAQDIASIPAATPSDQIGDKLGLRYRLLGFIPVSIPQFADIGLSQAVIAHRNVLLEDNRGMKMVIEQCDHRDAGRPFIGHRPCDARAGAGQR